MVITASIDDASASDVRFADLMHRYEIETVFYWPVDWHVLAAEKGYKPLAVNDAVRIAANHEVGSHGITHRYLTRIPADEAYYEISFSKIMLEMMFQTAVRKFCPPRGYTNDDLTDFTLGMYESQRLTVGPNLVHIHPDSGANDNVPWRDRVKELIAKDMDVELWGHGWEIDKFELWTELEGFLYEHTYS